MTKTSIELNNKLLNKRERHQLFGSVEPGPKIKPTTKEEMADLQNSEKDYLFKVDAVGISNVKYPIVVESKLNPTTQHTVGTFTLTSSIPRMAKGTNMSRFIEEMEASKQNGFKVDFHSLRNFSNKLCDRLEQDDIAIQVQYPWFYDRSGPSSQLKGLNHGEVTLHVRMKENKTFHYEATLSVYVTTLCPCSKEISEYSAHSQRGKVTMTIEFTDDFTGHEIDWKKELLHAAESNASAMIHPLLKRPDEKVVTETAYENPRFVEDVVRLVAADLYELPYVQKFTVTCQNEESIHMHDALAVIEFDKQNE